MSSAEATQELCRALEGRLPATQDELTKDPKHAARIWARIGQAQQRKRRLSEARNAYAVALRLDAGHSGALANLAQLEAHCGNYAAAKDLLARAIELEPANPSYAAFLNWLQGKMAAEVRGHGVEADS